jgi:hypothetical protein
MRTGLLLPLAALVIASVAGCGSHEGEESAVILQRDLTRVAPAPPLDVASPLELQKPLTSHSVQPRATTRAILASRRRKNDPKPLPAVLTIPATVAAPAPEAQPTPVEEPRSDRELLPGRTVTIIPVSSGPSTAADPGEDEGLRMIQQGHSCPPARPGIGIAGRPRPPALILD